MATSSPATSYGVLVPVKRPAVAKSRLAGLGDDLRTELAGAFAMDTVAAALESPAVGCVVAVTDDHVLAAALAGLGAHAVPDGVAGDHVVLAPPYTVSAEEIGTVVDRLEEALARCLPRAA